MKKVVKATLNNCTYTRGIRDLNVQLYSHDKNNAGFEFTIKNEVDLSEYRATVLFDFQDTFAALETKGTIEGNVVKAKFDTDLITRCEEVIGYLMLDSDTNSLDVFKFKFNVVLSQIDRPDLGKRGFRYIKDQEVVDVITRSELEEEIKKLQVNSGIDLSNYLTTSVAEATYVKKTDLPTPYNDSVLSERVTNLENRTDRDTVYNDTEVKERLTTLENKPPVDLSNYALKSELPQPYNDSALVQKIGQLEARVDKDTVYDDSEVKRRLTELEARPTGTSYNDKPLSDRVKVLEDTPKVDATEYNSFKSGAITNIISVKDRLSNLEKSFLSENNSLSTKINNLERQPKQTLTLSNNTLSISGGNSVVLPVNRYEIHGIGMPNGVVEAEIGTTYVDKNKTNGAFKWIKTTDGGNQGWEVLTGDTGWRRLNILSKLNTASLHIRRVNNMVTYQFGGLSWGWFGIVRRGGEGYVAQPTDLERNCYILNHNQIPEGFRTPNSLIGSIYNDNGVPYGTWYVGNPSDVNHLRFQFLNPVPTDRDIGDIRVSAISYFTNEPWPVQLP